MNFPIDQETGYFLYRYEAYARSLYIAILEEDCITDNRYEHLKANNCLTNESKSYIESLLDGRIIDDNGRLIYDFNTYEHHL